MAPEDYLRQYAEPLQALAGTVSSRNWQALALEPDYYYPPGSVWGSGLDALNRTDLLEMLQQILDIEYPQQRLPESVAREFPNVLQGLKDERAWRQTEMERLGEVLAQRQSDNERLAAELIEHQSELRRLAVELEHCQGESAVLVNEASTLRANLAELRGSTSWRLTKPLRWFGRMAKTAQVLDV
ncbi:MAG TPA: hypothetical protein P5102_03545 [Candidatus Competibacteraceae bacterium]|nr:hypothetical protein [Candidatus Competibacteraceae bacterium]HRZ05219.1 hypothetical protein [Candidatus Competibacteraceae bacterium]HSA45130.1 hypothetical protein [Candidatus Competibacteraceae bacterium]